MRELREGWRSIAVALLGVMLFLGAAVAQDRLLHKASFLTTNALDFREFYCGGAAVLQGADPYRVEPLRSCERRIAPAKEEPEWLAEPAPLPGYSLALFAQFARLDFGLARVLWECLLVASLVLSARLLAGLTRFPFITVLFCLIPTVGFLNLNFGEPAAIVIAALSLAGYLLARGLAPQAAIVAAGGMIEPHIGLPAMLALFVLVPKARLAVVAVAGTLGAISLVTIGVTANVEYFRDVLPLQAVAELAANDQYSLTRVAYLLGAPAALAIAIGSLSYATSCAAGIWFAGRLMAAGKSLALVLLVPSAAVTLGGSFIHDSQIAVAIPAALVLAAATQGWRRAAAFLALILLIYPWEYNTFRGYVFATALIAVPAILVTSLSRYRPPIRLGLAIGGLLATLTFGGAMAILPHHAFHADGPPAAQSAATPNDFAAVTWAEYIRSRPSLSWPDVRLTVEKIPTWLGLSIVLVVAACTGTGGSAARAMMPLHWTRARWRRPNAA